MTKYLGFGVEIAWDAAGGTSYETIAQVVDLVPPAIARDSVEATAHDSPEAWREFIKGLKDGGEVTLTIQWDPALGSHSGANGLYSDLGEDVTIPSWRITFPDADTTTLTFDGFLTAFPIVTPLGDIMTADITLKVTGKPVLS